MAQFPYRVPSSSFAADDPFLVAWRRLRWLRLTETLLRTAWWIVAAICMWVVLEPLRPVPARLLGVLPFVLVTALLRSAALWPAPFLCPSCGREYPVVATYCAHCGILCGGPKDRARGNPPMQVELPLKELQSRVAQLHGVRARALACVEVSAPAPARSSWRGTVGFFAISGHPSADHVYAWTYVTSDWRLRFATSLCTPPVVDAASAVRGWFERQADEEDDGARSS